MTYDGKLLALARARLDSVRDDNNAEHRRRLEQVYARVPETEQLDARMRAQMTELVRLTLARTPDVKERVRRLEDENLELQMRRAELLCEHGFSTDYLDDIYSCDKCHDTGIIGSKPCSCLERMYNAELTRELGTLMRSGNESFERFDLSLYDAAVDPATGVAPREAMEIVLESCRAFADGFPTVSKNLLFQGGTGLGKTYLSACIARVISGKGFSVCYDTASAAFEAFERQKFSRDADESEAAATRVRRMLSCDLMILDDLGTEMVTAMTVSALYTLINDRLVNRRCTIISTNCSADELKRRYSPQICSRITGEFVRLPFFGRDIRLIKKDL